MTIAGKSATRPFSRMISTSLKAATYGGPVCESCRRLVVVCRSSEIGDEYLSEDGLFGRNSATGLRSDGLSLESGVSLTAPRD